MADLVREGHFDAALAQCEAAVKTSPNDGEAWLLCGRIHLYRGDAQHATRCLRRAESCGMAFAAEAAGRELGRVAKGQAARDKCLELLSCGRRDDGALQHASAAVEASPGCASLRVLLAAARLVRISSSSGAGAGSKSSTTTTETKEDDAAAAASSSAAKPTTKVRVDEEEEDEDDRDAVAVAGDLKQAVMLTSPSKLGPSVARPAVQYARLMHRAGLTDEAMLLLRRVRDVMQVTSGSTTTTPTTTPTTAAEVEIVAKELDRFTTMDRSKAVANEAYAQGRFADAVELFSKAMALDPTHEGYVAVLLANRAAARMALGQFAQAVDDCDAALARLPTFVKARLRRARALARMGRLRDAVVDLELAYRAQPTPDIASELAEARRALSESTTWRKEYEARGFHSASSSSSSGGGGRGAGAGAAAWRARWSSSSSSGGSASFGGVGRGGAHQHQTPPPPPPPPSKPPTSSAVDFYQLLGVSPSATSAEIKRAFHKAALHLHPDKSKSSDKTSDGERFKSMLDAYNTLRDPIARSKYDSRFRVAPRVI